MKGTIPPSRARQLMKRLAASCADADANGYLSKVVPLTEQNYLGRFAGDCRNPYKVDLVCPPGLGTGKARWKWTDEFPEWEQPDFKNVVHWLDAPLKRGFSGQFYVRCWQCRECQHWRRLSWIQRATDEMRRHERTWLVTLTFAAGNLPQTDHQSEDGEREALEKFAVREGQRYLRALRDGGVAVRYLMVTEFGTKYGRLHLHALIHTAKSVKRRTVEARWNNGFIHCRLVRRGHKHDYLRPAEYIAKYLTKDCTTRVRASLRYGSLPLSEGSPPNKIARLSKGGRVSEDIKARRVPQDQTGLDAPF